MNNIDNNRKTIGGRVAIYPRGKKGIYHADYHYQGQHCRRSLQTTSYAVAREQAKILAARILAGTLHSQVTSSRSARSLATLEKARKAFIAAKKTDGRRPKTLKKYDGILCNFSIFCQGKVIRRLDQITLLIFDEYRAHRREVKVRGKHLREKTLHHDASLLKLFFKWCVDRKLMEENPLANQNFPRPTAKRKSGVLTLDQVDRILEAVPARMRGPIAVLAFTGMRSGNCRNLWHSDVDLENNWIHVRSRDGAETKCGNDWKVPIHPRLCQILEPLVKRKDGYLFVAPPSTKYPRGGHWINTKHLNDDLVAILMKLGIPAGREGGFTIHSLRHFFKSFCISHAVPREYVDEWQGHASIRSASDLYVHVFDEKSQEFIQQVPFGTGLPAAEAGTTRKGK